MLFTPEQIEKMKILAAEMRSLLNEALQIPALRKAAGSLTPAKKSLFALITALRSLSNDLHDGDLPGAEAVQTGIEAVRHLTPTAAAQLSPDFVIARRDWAVVGRGLSVQCSQLADELEVAEPGKREPLLVRAGSLLWSFVDASSVANSRYRKSAGADDDLAKAEGDYDRAVRAAHKVNEDNLAAGVDRNPRVTAESSVEVFRQAARLRQVRAKHGILS